MKKLSYNHTVYACYFGYITQAIVNNLTPLLFLILQDAFDLPLAKITLIITINFGIQLLIDLFGARFADRIGYRPLCVGGHLSAMIGLVGMGILPSLLRDPYVGILICTFFCAIGGGIDEVLVSPIVEACPSDNKEAAMSLLHSFYCWGCVAVIILSTLFLKIFGKQNWRILYFLWALIPLFDALYFTVVPIKELNEESTGMSIPELLKSGLFWLFFVLMITAGASEAAMSQWASAFAEKGLHVSKTLGDLLGPCLFAVMMGTVRTAYAKNAARLNILKCLIFFGSLCILSFLIAALSPWPALSLVGCSLTGVSVAIFWPGLFSLSAERMPKGGTACFALLALAGDVGCSTGPSLVGFMASVFHENLKAGLLFAILFPTVLIFGTLKLMKQETDSTR